MTRRSFQELREELLAYGFRPSRKLGQNFLVDRNLTRAIADSLPLDRETIVLEIGAGAGLLTRELVERAGTVVAVEIDTRLVAFLHDEILAWCVTGGEVRLVSGDVLGDGEIAEPCLDALRAAGAEETGFVCVSNLPYSIAGPTLSALACAELFPRAIVCLCQWEMGERILAEPGSSAYGGLTAVLGSCYERTLLRSVPAEVFRPRPKVRSALIALREKPDGLLSRPSQERRGFARFLQGLFGARRKLVRNALARVCDQDPDQIITNAGLGPQVLTVRPQSLDPETLWRVHRACLDSLS